MDKNFDLNRIGKRMPYTVPDGFFSKMEEDVWKKVKDIKPASRQRKLLRIRIVTATAAVAAVAALALSLRFSSNNQSETNILQVEQAFANLSSEDQAYILEVYQDDIFMNE